jgi:FtsP/CotA-like multicopper oxidase with cupredoxin domain
VIGSDGGLLEAPVSKPYLMLAPGERAEIWVDFGRGAEVALESQAFSAGHMGGGGGFAICRFSARGPAERLPLPKRLDPPVFRPLAEVANLRDPRRFQVSMAMMRWLLNGRPFEMTEVAPNERIRRGVTEDWEFSNLAGMMAMPHPIHIHGGQFQVVGRSLAPGAQAAAATVSAGLVDEGWKDTVLLMPGERIRLRVRFARHEGLFLYHCHNLEHEDMGMMRNFRVEA